LDRYFKARIKNNLSLNSKNSLLTIEPLEPSVKPAPGQFYMIQSGSSHDPLLKRPFSFFRKTQEGIQFLYRIKGKGTLSMRELKQDEVIDIIGPLGKGYPNPQEGYTPLLIAGGIGIASLFSLSEEFSKNAYMIYGSRNKDELIMINELEKIGTNLIICTDDCSVGQEGMVDNILNKFLSDTSLSAKFLIYCCGPKPMLEAISKIAIHNGIKGYVSLEENMACGFGACLGCAVKIKSQKSKARNESSKRYKPEFTYKRVCKEGPVFPIEEIVWE
jgi:dihydroorotate dehydrogenase electron transfer subunit